MVLVATQQLQCDLAAGVVDSMLRGRYALPLQAPIPPEVIGWWGKIAAWNLLVIRGFNASNPGDAAVRANFTDAMKELGEVQRQARHPNVIPAQQDSTHQQPMIISSSVVNLANGCTAPNRGW
jgi:phage gp36-like protein